MRRFKLALLALRIMWRVSRKIRGRDERARVYELACKISNDLEITQAELKELGKLTGVIR